MAVYDIGNKGEHLLSFSGDLDPTSDIHVGARMYKVNTSTSTVTEYLFDGATWRQLATEVSGNVTTTFRAQSYIIPLFQVTRYSGFTNQPTSAGTVVHVKGGTSTETGLLTLFGNNVVTSAYATETVTLSGTSVITTTLTSWGTIYGAFLGAADGQSAHSALTTVTIQDSADSAITTINTGNVSVGMINFALTDKEVVVHNISGNTWQRTGGIASVAYNIPSFKYGTADLVDEISVASQISFISDSAGSTVQMKVLT